MLGFDVWARFSYSHVPSSKSTAMKKGSGAAFPHNGRAACSRVGVVTCPSTPDLPKALNQGTFLGSYRDPELPKVLN